LLLAYLVLHPGSHAREKVAALFWPEVPDASARASLRNALSTLRRDLGRQLLQTDRETLQLNPGFPIRVDVLEFQALATRFLDAPGPDPCAVDLDVYVDDLLIDCYEDWVSIEREALRGLYLKTLLELTQQMRSRSEYQRAVEFAERILDSDRANERAHQHLMFCHVALGDRGAALRQYEACRSALSDELAVEPSAATKKLYNWVREAPAQRLPTEASITNLPIPATNFVGRQPEMAAVKDLLASVRLVTLTGAGGSGKTRLAIQVVTDLVDAYPDGVWWVELGAMSHAEPLPRAVMKALGAPEVPNQPMWQRPLRPTRSFSRR
jgi:DNA-binding SARP family transcriptional activator